jgi:hypothetical protein
VRHLFLAGAWALAAVYTWSIYGPYVGMITVFCCTTQLEVWVAKRKLNTEKIEKQGLLKFLEENGIQINDIHIETHQTSKN